MDAIFTDQDGMWYFYDETWSDFYGPYSTPFLAHLNMARYCHICLATHMPQERIYIKGDKRYVARDLVPDDTINDRENCHNCAFNGNVQGCLDADACTRPDVNSVVHNIWVEV